MSNTLLEKVVGIAEREGASDIRVVSGQVVTYRVSGDLKVIDEEIVSGDDVENTVRSIGGDFDKLKKEGALDIGISASESRVRIQVFNTLDGLCMSIRLIPSEIPAFDTLGLPEVIKSFGELSQGLVIVTGATGSGKSTTLASLINHVNHTQGRTIVTVEDPIEYVYTNEKSVINQRQLGEHVDSFDRSIAQAMRQDPDIMLVGELRDLDTITAALRMAETGHLVFGTLHTRGAAESFGRIIDVFPEGQQDQIRVQLANSVKGVVAQDLVKIGDGRVPLVEVMVVDSSVRSTVSNPKGNLSTLKDAIKTKHTTLGSQTFYQSVAKHVKAGRMSKEDAERVLTKEDWDSFKQYYRTLK